MLPKIIEMPQPIPSHSSEQSLMREDYPVTTKHAVRMINDLLTEVHTTYFLDKIMVLITQEDRLAQWVQVPFLTTHPVSFAHISSRFMSLWKAPVPLSPNNFFHQ